jgi:Arc/MetJ-type ribon-helix-helix transcriptional regulator
MSDAMAGTTFPDVPTHPERELRRQLAKELQGRGKSLTEISNQLGVPRWTVQDDLRAVPKAAPFSVRLPPDVDAQVVDAAKREGVSRSQIVTTAVRHWLHHRGLEEAKNARKRERRRQGEGEA